MAGVTAGHGRKEMDEYFLAKTNAASSFNIISMSVFGNPCSIIVSEVSLD